MVEHIFDVDRNQVQFLVCPFWFNRVPALAGLCFVTSRDSLGFT